MDEFNSFYNPEDISAWADVIPEQALAAMLNEILTPLNTIHGYAALLKISPVASEVTDDKSSPSMTVEEIAQIIMQNTDKLLRIRATLFEYARNRLDSTFRNDDEQ